MQDVILLHSSRRLQPTCQQYSPLTQKLSIQEPLVSWSATLYPSYVFSKNITGVWGLSVSYSKQSSLKSSLNVHLKTVGLKTGSTQALFMQTICPFGCCFKEKWISDQALHLFLERFSVLKINAIKPQFHFSLSIRSCTTKATIKPGYEFIRKSEQKKQNGIKNK